MVTPCRAGRSTTTFLLEDALLGEEVVELLEVGDVARLELVVGHVRRQRHLVGERAFDGGVALHVLARLVGLRAHQLHARAVGGHVLLRRLGILLDELGGEARRSRRATAPSDRPGCTWPPRPPRRRASCRSCGRSCRWARACSRRRPGPATSDATCWPIGSSITVVPVAPARSSIVLASVTFWMPGPDAIRLPLRSAMVLAGLSLRDDELVEHVLGVARDWCRRS